MTEELPQLPEPTVHECEYAGSAGEGARDDFWDRDAMRAYARQAIAAATEIRSFDDSKPMPEFQWPEPLKWEDEERTFMGDAGPMNSSATDAVTQSAAKPAGYRYALVVEGQEVNSRFIEGHRRKQVFGRPDVDHGGEEVYEPFYFATPPQPATQAADEYETRADGQRVRKDRWEWCVRRIVALLWGNRTEFETGDVVEAVRKLMPEPNEDDEGLVSLVGRGFGRPVEAKAPERNDEEQALDLLAELYTAYENGAACYEDPDPEEGLYIGNAVRLDSETETRIADLLNRRRPVDSAAGHSQREGDVDE